VVAAALRHRRPSTWYVAHADGALHRWLFAASFLLARRALPLWQAERGGAGATMARTVPCHNNGLLRSIARYSALWRACLRLPHIACAARCGCLRCCDAGAAGARRRGYKTNISKPA